ncbi:MAG: DUF488 domain-containing protein [Candidatus Cloacimonas sp.]|nr:DUF488 domain-containing protein [Candidatus Cloacimonadota bacterium]
MLYRRQKALLYLISVLDGVSYEALQALLFINYKQTKLAKSYYDFFPYQGRAFSFTVRNDIEKLTEENLLTKNEQYLYCYDPPKTSEFEGANEFSELALTYGSMEFAKLLQTANSLMPKPHSVADQDEILYTLGYEGRSIDAYFNELVKYDIKVVLDIRATAFSHKRDFISARLKHYSEEVGIDYLWLPELGIPKKARNQIVNRTELFDYYANTILPQKEQEINEVIDLLMKKKRIVLTCMESDPNDCHRSRLTKKIEQLREVKVVHL